MYFRTTDLFSHPEIFSSIDNIHLAESDLKPRKNSKCYRFSIKIFFYTRIYKQPKYDIIYTTNGKKKKIHKIILLTYYNTFNEQMK